MRYRIVILVWVLCYIPWAWITIGQSIWCGCFWWPFHSRAEANATVWFTALMLVSFWNLGDDT